MLIMYHVSQRKRIKEQLAFDILITMDTSLHVITDRYTWRTYFGEVLQLK